VTSRSTTVGDVTPESSAEAESESCKACGAEGLVAFYEIGGVPAQTCVLLDNSAEARAYPTGDILLAYCNSCGFIQNVRFDLDLVDYSKPTEESQAFSPRFIAFATELANDLVERHKLKGKSVLEIGCGKGDFLQLLAEQGIGTGLGIDPGYLPNREVSGKVMEFRREWFGPDDTHLTGDLVITRHLMEHVPNVGEFFGWLTESTRHTPGSVTFTEVPDTTRVLAEGAFWDVYHEHCSYFTLGSLARTIRGAGMTVTDLRYGFDDQYLLATSVLDGNGDGPFPAEDTPAEVADLAKQFAAMAAAKIARWRSAIRAVQTGGGSVAVWGGGSKAVTFLTSIGLRDVTVVDINPHKQGKWLPGVGVEVQPPAVLKELRPGLVVPMNPIYVAEITRDLEQMGLLPGVEAL
jgi:SAM-dependent methyltransferase